MARVRASTGAREQLKAKGPGQRPGPFVGGGTGTRTPNPLLAKQVRYQLRHAPRNSHCPCGHQPDHTISSVALLQTFLLFSESCHRLYTRTPAAAAAARSNFFTTVSLQSPSSGGSVGVPGLEPGTSSLSAKRSNRLSYTPRYLFGPRHDFTVVSEHSSNRPGAPRSSSRSVVREGHTDATDERR
jgi:hypothetical protein